MTTIRRNTWGAAAAACLALAACGGGEPAAESGGTTAAPSAASVAARRTQPARAEGELELDAEIDALLDWAQRRYPDLFPGSAVSSAFGPYRYRAYPAAGNHVGVAYGDAYVQGRGFGSEVPVFVGSLHRYNCEAFPATCSVAVLSVGPGRDLGCAQYQEQRIGSAVLTNNVWNPQPAGSFPHEQCVRGRDTAAGPQYGWRWKWPSPGQAGSVFSNPALVYGLKPWLAGSTTDPRLPAAVATLAEFSLAFDLESGSNGVHNTVATLWLTRARRSSPDPNPGEISTTVMVWAHDKGMTPAGTLVGSVTAGGLVFDVYYAPSVGDPAAYTWKYVAYRLRGGKLDVATTFDLKALLADAVSRGYVSASEYVASVEIGNEIQGGSGYTWLRSVQLRLGSL